MEELRYCETWEMQANRQAAAGNEDSVNFCKRFLNVHVREGYGGHYTIKAPVRKR